MAVTGTNAVGTSTAVVMRPAGVESASSHRSVRVEPLMVSKAVGRMYHHKRPERKGARNARRSRIGPLVTGVLAEGEVRQLLWAPWV